MTDRRRSKSCNEAERLSKQSNATGALATTAIQRKSRLPISTNKYTSVNKNTSLVSSVNINNSVVDKSLRSRMEKQRSVNIYVYFSFKSHFFKSHLRPRFTGKLTSSV
jgi:hypothetical protein